VFHQANKGRNSVDGIVAARLRVFSRRSCVFLLLTGGQTPWPACPASFAIGKAGALPGGKATVV